MTVPVVPTAVFRAVVTRVEELTPSLRRVVLGGPGLAGFVSTGVGDEYVRLVLAAPGATEPVLPAVVGTGGPGGAGVLDWGSVDAGLLRTYTVRDHDPARGEVTVDLVVHEGGVAATWARRARPGDAVGITSPTGMYDPPEGLRRQLLVADLAGLPAPARVLGTVPAGVRTRVVVEVPDDGRDHRVPLPGAAEVTWLRGGNGLGPSRLEDVVRSLPRPGADGHVWVAGEARALRGVRAHLRRELGLPASAYTCVGYWIEDGEAWTARYRALDDDVRRELEAMWHAERPEEEIEEEYDARLTSLGL